MSALSNRCGWRRQKTVQVNTVTALTAAGTGSPDGSHNIQLPARQRTMCLKTGKATNRGYPDGGADDNFGNFALVLMSHSRLSFRFSLGLATICS